MKESDETSIATNDIVIREKTVQQLDTALESNEEEQIRLVEATLFIAGRFLTIQELVMITDLNPLVLKESLYQLEKRYAEGAIQIINRGSSWKMDVSRKYYPIVNKLATGSNEFTKAEQGTLAVIAYKQPIKQSVVIKIRGNKAYDHISKFTELGLLVAKREGHTRILSLSEEFYEYFNVQKTDSGEKE